ncbi:MAG: HNH endonuclease [Saprospiraceae bacterium]|nr:HNH endonuclease [Saprospiraceae bacterium]
MINLKRSLPAPTALAGKSFEGVKEQLKRMQFDKCYLCERKAPDTSQIEHFIPVNKDISAKFDWNNLFLACSHCNSIKNYVSDSKSQNLKLLNCTDFNNIITDLIEFSCDGKPKEKVVIREVDEFPSQEVKDTVLLLHSIFNYESDSLSFDAKALTDEVIIEMKKLLDLLHTYEYDSHSEGKRKRVLSDIQDCLSIEAPFTAFKIWYIKKYFSDSEFKNMLPDFRKK